MQCLTPIIHSLSSIDSRVMGSVMDKKKQDVLVIAEAGVNHNGSLEMAKQLAHEARRAGADIVKYQIFESGMVASRHAEKADYQKTSKNSAESQLEMIKKLELSNSEFIQLKEHCDSIGIEFLATSFDKNSTSFLENVLKPKLFKIPSGEITNYPYLVQIAKYGKPIIMSCGMATVDDIRSSVEVLRDNGACDITLLHCNTQYPTPYCDVNLLAMDALAKEFGVRVGYSDHTLGIEVPIAAVALGATVIEKHFTLDKTLEGPDHKASLEPEELRQMVASIRNIEVALGSANKTITPSESGNIAIARKSIVAKYAIKKGELFSEENITTKRPGTGMSPMLWRDVIGREAPRDFESDELICL